MNMTLRLLLKWKQKVGEIVTFEGKITLNKDFGSGYFYNIIMEDAKMSILEE